MGKDHTNIRSDLPYEMLQGKCAADFKGEDRRKILEDNAPQLDMGTAPTLKGKKGKSSGKDT